MTEKKKKNDFVEEDVTDVSLKLDEDLSSPMMNETLEISDDVPVRLFTILGNKDFVLKDLLSFKVGQVIDLKRPANEFVDLMVNGKVIAKGELVEIDGKLGVRIIKLLKS